MSSLTRVGHQGHTSFYVAHGAHMVLVDPVLVRAAGSFRKEALASWFVPHPGNIGAVVISHAHDDHLHPPSILGLAPDTRFFVYEEACEQKLRRLGCRDVARVFVNERIEILPGIHVLPVPAQPSVEGTEQCALLLQTPDVLVFDGVDVRDSKTTREVLGPYRGEIDLAFLPAGASLQWQGTYNQMDPVDSATFAAWLDAKMYAPCGGLVSAAGDRGAGSLERYPYDRADWHVALGRQVPMERLYAGRPPSEARFSDHAFLGSRSIHTTRTVRHRAVPECQAPVAAYFSGYHPTFPMRCIVRSGADVQAAADAWTPYHELLRESVDQVAALLRRAPLEACRSTASFWIPRTLEWLREQEHWELAADLVCMLPASGDLERAHELFLARVESRIRRGLGGGELQAALACAEFDGALLALEREHRLMLEFSRVPKARLQAAVADHEAQLATLVAKRRPRLTPNHVLVQRDDIQLLTGSPPPSDVQALLFVATPDGVERIPLDNLQKTILDRCDGRRLAEVSRDVERALGTRIPTIEEALFRVLLGLSRRSVQLIDWGTP